MRHRGRLLFAATICLLVGVSLVQSRLAAVHSAPAISSGLVISQVYGGGGNSGATLKNDFIELFNMGSLTVDVSNWSVQYASASGTSWQVTNLCAGGTCTIAPGHYYLIQEALGAGGTSNLPNSDATGIINLSATAGKVALVNNTTALTGACPLNASVVDFVGYGSANCFEGNNPTSAPGNITSVIRINSGCTDTDNNSTDFAEVSPNPRNSAAPAITCGVSPSPTPTPAPSPTVGCGVERWSVKTGTDADAASVTFVPQPTTIATMRSWTAPAPIPSNNRVAPYETTEWTVNATLVEFKLEDDSDYHIVIRDDAGNTIITEIPHPSCVGAGSPFAVSIASARAKFNAMFTPTSSFQFANVPVQITGVGMFDFLHGQTGVAPNGIEIHPVLDINFPSAAPTLQLSAPSFAVTEGTADAVVTVTRTGNTTTAATVDFATSDTAGANNCNVVNGAASSRCDYITTIGTLQFAANETSRNILIPIVDDSYAEGSEAFTITLSNPTGATLGSPTSATVTISDNGDANGANPIDQTSFFVRQHYLDFLNREPDTGGIGFWTNEIDGCAPKPQCTEIKRINVSAAFFLSIEFQQTGYLIERIYKASYGDANGTSTLGGAHQLSVPVVRLNEFLADTQKIGQGVVVGQTGWETVLESNKQAFTLEFVQRSRFVTMFPTAMAPTDFVARLFISAGVLPTFAERQAAINEFGSATNTADVAARSRVLRRVADNSTLVQQEFNRAFVLMQFIGYLRRNPNDPQDIDYTGYEFWLNKLNQFNGNYINAEMVKGFISSGEYRQRFGP